MRVGILLLQDVPWKTLRERALRADELGFDTIWVADHVVNPYDPLKDWLEAWTALGALAATTSHARLGALVTSLTLRNPTLLVQAVRALHDISGGRAELALGAGGAPLDHQLTGIPAWTPAEREEHYEEFVPLVANLIREGRPPGGHAGGHYPVEGVGLSPLGGVRITVGALGPRSIALAARHGDAWNSYGVPAGKRVTARLLHDEAVDLFRKRAARFERLCREAGRDPATIDRSYLWVDGFMEPGLLEPSVCVGRARDYREAGATEFILYWPADDTLAVHLPEALRRIRQL
jgi:alkanesulfonate monooxygenase SsuD/methylene tetrahydromethanopterin reductase-like flavin-dependent oxidoreductase (luciferase family)